MIARLLGAALAVSLGGNLFQAVDKFGLGPWIEGDRAHIARQDALISDLKAAGEVKAAVATHITKGADDAHTPRLAAARAATVRYVDRVRTVGCDRPTQTPAAPEGPNPASPAADMVAVSRDDLDILVENTVRLETVHQWGEKLIEDGLAVDVEF